MKSKTGKIYFVGAGPGDPELITLKGLKALQQAEVVVYDRLVHPSLLLEVKADTKLIYCGKQPCKHTLRQSDIQKELIIQAKKGKTVVRLKGGDPAVFGRVGEEAEAAAKQRIAYEIVPGITAGSAAAIYSGVPLTHRDHSRSFAIVTGHSRNKDGKPNIAWGDLARSVDTIVFYMGVKNLSYIAQQLIKEGKDPYTSTLVTEWGTYGRQRSMTGSLAEIPHMAEKYNMSNPAVIVVGDVTKLHDSLQWITEKPLSGQGIITIPSDTTDKHFAQGLEEEGAGVYLLNKTTEESDLSKNSKEIMARLIMDGHANYVLVQDVPSAKALLNDTKGISFESEDIFSHVSFICMGKETEQVVRERGYKPAVVLPVLSSTDTLVDALSEKQNQDIV
ncbi:uroporphyrinogen-III C-methyltransferase [Alteribacillus sp. YIM 98480]|uniref:uroporphyrinogen-III C-methyltransferase n=1 Tax=Alteribacillus sp. YIM 98480 TaxID=2606599 RepID=UPI00131B0F6B|nr:uroporphyrinogen-III C-methyltransferase [Alteribacillus sp. YIM 98480]